MLVDNKIEVGDTVSFCDTVHLIVEGFTESGWIIPKSNNTVLKYVSSVNPNACSLVKKATIDKDKKIENLQAIISKNYKKIENQAKEITLLIQQKEELRATLEIAKNGISLQIDENLRMVNILESCIKENTKLNAKISHMDRVIKSLSDEITQKDGVIAYLENKLELNKQKDKQCTTKLF